MKLCVREYLVSGFYQFYGQLEQKLATCVARLTDDEVMDKDQLLVIAANMLREQNREGTIAVSFHVTGFLLLESKEILWDGETWRYGPLEVHLNECSVTLPPVDSPLLIELAPDVLLPATREAHAEKREDLLVLKLDAGGWYTGRPRWTHP